MGRRMDTREAAEYLGLSRHTIYQLAEAKQLPHYKVGSKLVFDEAELDEWMAERRVTPETEATG